MRESTPDSYPPMNRLGRVRPVFLGPQFPVSAPTTPMPSRPKRPNVLNDWIELSTFHGILDLVRPNYGKCWRATWITVMVAFTGVAIYSIEEVITEYINNPTIQNYREESRNSFPLPDITICTHEAIDPSVLMAMGASDTLVQDLVFRFQWNGATSSLEPEDPTTNWGNIGREYDEFRAKNGNITYEQILRVAGIKCEDLVRSCTWDASCCRTATPYLDKDHGLCYRFKTESLMWIINGVPSTDRDQTYPGASGGFSMILNTGFVSEDVKNHVRGVLVEVLYPNETAANIYSMVPAGVYASLQLMLQVTERINMFGRPKTCQESSPDDPTDENGRISLNAMMRTSNGCYYAAWSTIQKINCGCTIIPGIIEIPLCEPYDTCMERFYLETLAETKRLQDSTCLPQCKLFSYAVSMSYSKFDTAAYYKRMNISSQGELILLDVFYPRMEYLKVTEVEVYSIMTLISNIGGAVGLWLGASLMSILQLVFYFSKWLSIRK